MVVQHNLTAMNSNRMLGLTAATQAKSTEKLSSGYKVNRAADDAAGLSLTGNISTDTGAKSFIAEVKTALETVSSQRSELGAIQNRLEHTINNLNNVVENTTAAESQIRDTDMATEMVKYSNNNILSQAGSAMLSQAMQNPQSILQLLS